MYQEDQDYEFNARFDSVSEAFAATAHDPSAEYESKFLEVVNEIATVGMLPNESMNVEGQICHFCDSTEEVNVWEGTSVIRTMCDGCWVDAASYKG